MALISCMSGPQAGGPKTVKRRARTGHAMGGAPSSKGGFSAIVGLTES
jgi:hypothetical protein